MKDGFVYCLASPSTLEWECFSNACKRCITTYKEAFETDGSFSEVAMMCKSDNKYNKTFEDACLVKEGKLDFKMTSSCDLITKYHLGGHASQGDSTILFNQFNNYHCLLSLGAATISVPFFFHFNLHGFLALSSGSYTKIKSRGR